MKKITTLLYILFLSAPLFSKAPLTIVNLWMDPSYQSATLGSSVSITVKADNFTDIAAMQFTIDWDPAILQFDMVNNFNLAGMSAASFGNALPGKLTSVWYEPSITGITLPAGTALFTMHFTMLGLPGSSTLVSFSDYPTPRRIYDPLVVAHTLTTQTAQVECVTNAMSLFGNVRLENGTDLAGVDLVMDLDGVGNRTSNVSGNFEFGDLTPGGYYSLTPSKTGNHAEGLSVLDLYRIGKHVLGIEPLPSPYAIIRADANGSSSITGLDIAELRKLLLGIYSELPSSPAWEFVPAEYVFPNPSNPFSSPIPGSTLVEEMVASTQRDFIALKVGNVIETAALGPPLLELSAAAATATAGSTVSVPVAIVGGFENLVSMQFSMSWDPAILQFLGPQGFNIPSLSAANIYAPPGSGTLALAWTDNNYTGVTVPDGTVMFQLDFQLIGSPGAVSPINFTESPVPFEVTDNAVNSSGLLYTDGSVTVSGGGGSITCNDVLSAALDANCEFNAAHDVFLEGIFGPAGDYQIEIFEGPGFTIPVGSGTGSVLIPSGHAGQTLVFLVTEIASGDNCWGYLTLEDKTAPAITSCPADATVSCTDSENTALTGEPLADDNCDDDVALSYQDNLLSYCSPGLFHSLVERIWTATDDAGNTSTCAQLITTSSPDLNLFSAPPDITIALGDPIDPSFTGNPQYDGGPFSGYCIVGIGYTDQVYTVPCGDDKIFREWTIIDWCEYNPPLGVWTAQQIITIQDNSPTPTWYKDSDNDGYSPGNTIVSCSQPSGYKLASDLISLDIDCKDNDPLQFPGQIWYKDWDNDGWSDGTTMVQCLKPTGFKAAASLIGTSGDCADGSGKVFGYPPNSRANIYPGAPELCNSIDDDCDGIEDEGLSGYTYTGNLTFTSQIALDEFARCHSAIIGNLTLTGPSITDLSPLENLVSVSGNLKIQNTGLSHLGDFQNLAIVGGSLSIQFNSQLVMLFALSQTLTIGSNLTVSYNQNLFDCCAIEHFISSGGVGGTITILNNKTGCNSKTEVSNACLSSLVWHEDADGDGFGDPGSSVISLSQPPGYVADDMDCDDTKSAVNPLAGEICNNIDDDCDGLIDLADPDLVDLDNPHPYCYYGLTINLTAGYGFVWASDFDAGSYDDCSAVTITASFDGITYTPGLSLSCTDVGAPVFIYMGVTDAAGNFDYCTSFINVLDSGPGVVCKDITVQLDATGQVSIVPNDVFLSGSDDCSVLNLLSVSPNSFNCGNLGPNPVTLIVEDGNSHQASCIATVTVEQFATISSVTISDETCAGSSNGSISIVATSATGPLEYSIDGGATFSASPVFNNLAPGVYNIVVIPQGSTTGCDATASATVLAGVATPIWYRDQDNDGYSSGVTIVGGCTPPAGGYKLASDLISLDIDCKDKDPLQFPGQIWYKDVDNDGYSDGVTLVQCLKPAGYKAAVNLISITGDCADGVGKMFGYPPNPRANIYPGAPELCNSIDDDCDGTEDEGLSGFTYTGNLTLSNQASVDNFPPCYTTFTGNLTINGLTTVDLSPLGNLSSISGDLKITGTNLTDMDGLQNIASIGGRLIIQNNQDLLTLDGLNPTLTVGSDLTVKNNSDLYYCCAIEHLLLYGGVGGLITISTNQTGCDSELEVETTCPLTAVLPPPVKLAESGESGEQRMEVFPNPTTGTVFLRLEGYAGQALSIQVYSSQGQQLLERNYGQSEFFAADPLDLGSFANGMYLIRVRIEGNAEELIQRVVLQRD